MVLYDFTGCVDIASILEYKYLPINFSVSSNHRSINMYPINASKQSASITSFALPCDFSSHLLIKTRLSSSISLAVSAKVSSFTKAIL
jgi:hypothetical protein